MIVKITPNNDTGSFRGLADYLMDKLQIHKDKVEDINFTNCPFSDVSGNLDFIEHQQFIKDTPKDKTMHIVVTFQEDEKPSKEQLADIEQELVKSIGLEDHLRLSVTHTNTNNYHMHIAINRINPESYTREDPYKSKLKLQKKATELEEKHKLKRDNHIPNWKLAENKSHKSNETKKTKEIIYEPIQKQHTKERVRILRTLQRFGEEPKGGATTAKPLSSLRNLSDIDMVHDRGGATMLLQDDERDSLQRGGGTDNQLRRKRASDSSTTSRDTIAHSGTTEMTQEDMYNEMMEELANSQPPTEISDENIQDELMLQEDQAYFGMSDDMIYDEMMEDYGSDELLTEMTQEDMYNEMMEELANSQPPTEISDENIQDELMGGDKLDKTPSQSKDTIAHSGISNLTDWIKENVLDDLKSTLDDPQGNWQQLHRVLAKYNLEIAERGNGLIIRDKTRKLFIKASTVDRSLSQSKLIHKYGKIEPCDATDIKPTLSFGQERTDFWDKYQGEMKASKETKKLKLDNLKEHQSKEIDSIKQKWSKKREQLKQSNLLSGRFKKQMYQEYYAKQRVELQEVYEKSKTERQEVYTQHKQKRYKDWLIAKATAGDTKALATLRRKLPKPQETENTLGGKINHWIYTAKKPLITKQGYVVYRSSSSKIIDKGNHLKITEISNESLLEALDMARNKYGKNIEVTGDDAFKERVATLVYQHRLDIGFKDRAMRQLLSDTRAKERESSKVNKGNSLTF